MYKACGERGFEGRSVTRLSLGNKFEITTQETRVSERFFEILDVLTVAGTGHTSERKGKNRCAQKTVWLGFPIVNFKVFGWGPEKVVKGNRKKFEGERNPRERASYENCDVIKYGRLKTIQGGKSGQTIQEDSRKQITRISVHIKIKRKLFGKRSQNN